MSFQKLILALASALALTLGAILPAQAGTVGCPHQGIRPVPSKLTFGPFQECGTSVDVRIRGVHLRNPLNGCPMFAIYEPPHDKPTPKKNFRTKFDRNLPIVMIRMECSSDWLLGFIPIPIGSSCKIIDTKNIGWVSNYVEFQCDDTEADGSR